MSVRKGSKIIASASLIHGTNDFDELINRPSYNGTAMTHITNIPEVKTETWDGKQDAITDLEEIRAGAEAGSTAAQHDYVDEAVATEAEAREQAEEIFQGQLESLSTHIDTEIQNRIDADAELEESKQDVATALNYNNITNCITQIPQDIKLELNNGVLTLKAGSKIYVPNEFESDEITPKFDVIVIQNDISKAITFSGNHDNVVACYKDGDFIYRTANENSSGATDTGIATNRYWYDTTHNIIKYTTNGGSTYTNGWSFPLGVFSNAASTITSINQVFNGFGYIGSTVFALPGVKGLTPNRRNADGSLKNTGLSLSSVKTASVTTVASAHNLLLLQDGIYFDDDIYTPNWQFVYKEEENILINTGNGHILNGFIFGKCITDSNNSITSFTPKTTFHALDYNDKGTISGWGMPSDKYTDLTLGASGSEYIAPANGWVFVVIKATSTSSSWGLINVARNRYIQGLDLSRYEAYFFGFVPIKKGLTYIVNYGDATFTTHRFIYAEGEN